MNPLEIPDPESMEALGQALGRLLRPGDAVCLSGPLGAGKTTLTRGIALGLGVSDVPASPTFVIARRYAGRVGLLHCDAYRIGGPEEFEDLALETEDVVTVVEWGERVMPAVADSWLEVIIERSSGAGSEMRRVTVRPAGPRWDDDDWDALSTTLERSGS